MVSFLKLLLSAAVATAAPSSRSLERRNQSWDTWCGAIVMNPPGQIHTVEASWVVPTVSKPAGGYDQTDYVEYHWVGIDGSGSCQTGILQAGTSGDVSIIVRGARINANPWGKRSRMVRSQPNSGGSSGPTGRSSSATSLVRSPLQIILLIILTQHSESRPGGLRQGHRQ